MYEQMDGLIEIEIELENIYISRKYGPRVSDLTHWMTIRIKHIKGGT